jgi:hypothetical protein
MSGKSRAFAMAVATAGIIGMWAPAASAVTGPSGDHGGVVNISHNQVPIQACNDTVPVNVLGVQVPVDRAVGSLGVLSGPSATYQNQDTSCHQASSQANATDDAGTSTATTGDTGAPAPVAPAPGTPTPGTPAGGGARVTGAAW